MTTKRAALPPMWYPSPIDLPARRGGNVAIVHRTVKGETPIIGIRQAIVRGIRPVTAVLSKPLRVHELRSDEHGLWMTDLPEELNQIAEMLHLVKPLGNVLVGGLGLGIVAKVLRLDASVDRIVVVERDANVIKLCAERKSYEVVHDDIRHFLETTNDRFDCYLLDTWQGTSEATWWGQVFPLRRIVRQRWGSDLYLHCWAEDMMIGQMERTMLRGNRSWFYEGLPKRMSAERVRAFFRDVGLPEWERRYGSIYPPERFAFRDEVEETEIEGGE